MSSSQPRTSNPRRVLAVVLLVASAVAQNTNSIQLSKGSTTAGPFNLSFIAPAEQMLTFYLSEPHDGHFIEIKKGDKVIFSMTPDGKSEHTDEYKPDAVAVQFWKDLTSAYADVCKVKAEVKP